MKRTTSVFLVGPMGAGKSTIGRLLSSEMKLEFIDSDKVIEERCGANIPWIFDKEGEAGFREREEQVIDELTMLDGIVLATGGGAVMREANRRHLAGRGMVVYLCTSVEQQLARTAKDKNRPLLQNDNPEKILRDLFAKRDPMYREVADIVIQTDRRNPRWVVQELQKRLKG
ncbi:shikimate kinase AroK [Thalassolituus marinus]|jgi:shikimate kinase|uniref:Shikimate kinase n=1 Tax=Thalassolituus marinus TaxID=671053 RepID=A0ABS7ZLY4_9GAMM|nr:shikimate kinase AroK [Thalassolituus marinus]MCA6062727.1 shikimate kinase AroK [Thalassolituus marinus]